MLNLAEAVVEIREDDVLREVERRAKQGDDPSEILSQCAAGMVTVGERFAAGEYFLAELMMAGEVFKEATALLDPYIKAKTTPEKSDRGIVIMATPKGDIHEIGKNVVVMMLETYGFEVRDLGVDVDPKAIVDKVAEIQPQFLGLSALLTTSLASCKKVGELLVAEGLRDKCKFLVGGGVTTPTAKDYIGADFQSTDVMEGVEYCLSVGADAN